MAKTNEFPFAASMVNGSMHLTYKPQGGAVQAWEIPQGYLPQLAQLIAGNTSASKVATGKAPKGKAPAKRGAKAKG